MDFHIHLYFQYSNVFLFYLFESLLDVAFEISHGHSGNIVEIQLLEFILSFHTLSASM